MLAMRKVWITGVIIGLMVMYIHVLAYADEIIKNGWFEKGDVSPDVCMGA